MPSRRVVHALLLQACLALSPWALRAHAAEVSTAEGCRVVVPEAAAEPDDRYAWKGACIDGYADGPGRLTRSFEAEGKPRESAGHGQMKRGRRVGVWLLFTGAPGRMTALRVQALDAAGKSMQPVAGPFSQERSPDARAAVEQAHALVGSATTPDLARQQAEIDAWISAASGAAPKAERVARQQQAAQSGTNAAPPSSGMSLPPPSNRPDEQTPEQFARAMDTANRCSKDPAAKAEPAFARPTGCDRPAPVRTRLTHQQCIERAIAIQQRWKAEGDRATSAAASAAAEQRAQTALKALFQRECAHDPEAPVWIAKADESLRRLGGPASTAASTTRFAAGHDASAVAHGCVRPNYGQSYGGFTNTCGFAISYIHCIYRPPKFTGDSQSFDCERAGGLWANRTTAGNVRAGATDHTSLPPGGRVFWFACREPYAIRDAAFDGSTLRGACVRA